MKTAIYARVSRDTKDPEKERGLAIERQVPDCRKRAEAVGWDVVDVYDDNDISASTLSKKPRPGYQRMLADIRAGKVQAVIAYSNSRLTRRPAEWIELIALANSNALEISTVASGQYDLTTADGRAVAMTVAIWDAAEAERTGERVARQKKQRAEMGLPQGGRERLYGYTRDWEVIEEEAAVIREAFERRARGESTTAIARDFETRGLVTVAGNPWRGGTLGTTLTKPGYAGLREFKGEIIGKTVYPSIVDEVTFTQANNNLAQDRKGTNARKHPLSGFLVCSKCWTAMKGNSNKGSYQCARTYGGCGSTTIQIKWTNKPVLEAAVRKHEEKKPSLEPVTAPRDFEAEVAEIDAEIKTYQDAASRREISPADVMPIISGLRRQRDQVIKEEAEQRAATTYRWDLEAVLRFENDMNLSQQRLFIGDVISSVVVYPAPGRGRQTREAALHRLEIHYKDGEIIRLGEPQSSPAASAS